MKLFLGIIVAVVGYFGTLTFSLSNMQCSQHNSSLLFSLASSIAESASKILVPSTFSRVSKG